MRKTNLHLIIILICLIFTGCAHEARDSVMNGDKCIVNNNFCEAITHYAKAMELSPERAKDQTFKTNLQYAKKECAKFHYKKGADCVTNKQLDDAVSAFKASLSVDPDNKKARLALEQALNIKAENIMSAADNYQEGLALAAKKDWRNAVVLFQQVSGTATVQNQAQEQLGIALQEIRRAEEIYVAAMLLFEKKKWADAVAEFVKVLSMDPAHSAVSDKLRLAQAEIAAGKEHYLQGVLAFKQNNSVEAIRLFKGALQHNPEQLEARNALADVYCRGGKDQAEKGNSGNAVLLHTKALTLQSDHKDAKAGLEAVEREIKKRISCNLVLLPLKEYSRDPELSNALYAALRNKLLSAAKDVVKIVDNKPLEKLAEDNDISVEKLVDGKNSILLKSLPGVNAVLTGKIVTFKITTAKNVENLSKQYQSGTSQKRNPEYDIAVAKARLANQAAEAARRAAAQVGGVFDLLGKVVSTVTNVNTGMDVANTPEYVEEPVYSTWRYKVNHHKKKAEVTVSFRLMDSQSSELIAEESIPAQVEFAADSIDNPNPEIGIEDKPLPFDSDDELKTALILKATDQISGTLAETMHKYARKYLIAAKRSDSATDRVQAVENYMNFVYAIPADSSTYATELKKVREYLESVDIIK